MGPSSASKGPRAWFRSRSLDLFDPSRGPLAPAIRAEIFGVQRFAQHGFSLAESHGRSTRRRGPQSFLPRLEENRQVLRQAHAYLLRQASADHDVSPGAVWLLDHFDRIEVLLRSIREDLPPDFLRQLPVLVDEPLRGLPRIYGVAWAFIAHTDSAFDEKLLSAFLAAYQQVRPLDLAELWALPTVLRVLLVENLRRLGERVAVQQAARARANRCCNEPDRLDLGEVQAFHRQFEARGEGATFLAQMDYRMASLREASAREEVLSLRRWVEEALLASGTEQAQRIADEAADNLSIGNAIRSLRAIADASWVDLVAEASVVVQTMLGVPLFAAETSATRDRTLHAIEDWARTLRITEARVAEALAGHLKAEQAGAAAVASWWLEGEGRARLAASLGIPARKAVPTIEWHGLVLPAYLGAWLLITAALSAWAIHSEVGGASASEGWLWLAALLAFFPASEAAIAVIHRLVGESRRPAALPRLAWPLGIPATERVLVVIPALLTRPDSARPLAGRLHRHYLANLEDEAQFALLTDWADAPEPTLASDAAMLEAARLEIMALNAQHPRPGAPPRFLLLHRGRRFSATEQAWIGWERKRGKLEELVAEIVTGVADRPAAFLDLGECSRIAPGTRHVLTLDSDTSLPPGALLNLVGTAAHPANRPVIDPSRRRLIRGYAILQPRLVTPLPSRREDTLFHRLFSGQGGLDPYSMATSETYQDLFDAGSFSGKGLLQVEAVHVLLGGRLPQDLVLSHDLLEGALCHCAVVGDVQLVEDAPFVADLAAARSHRWMRGDWQLLPILLRPGRWPLRGVDRWKMVDNLRRSLVAPASLALLVTALLTNVPSPWSALGLVLAAFTAGPLMGALTAFARADAQVARRHFHQHAVERLAIALGGGAWHLATLPLQARTAADAIVRAVYRMTVSRRRLLQWTTAADLQASLDSRLAATASRHWKVPVLALLLLMALLAADTRHALIATGLCLLWAASPVWSWGASRTRKVRDPLSAEDRIALQALARDTWRYFELTVGEEDHHLPPDNLQTLPHEAVAHRTSPTNIGMYLLSAACARSFGWIGVEDLLSRIESTLSTLRRLPRYRGHWLNWYDTRTLEALQPLYVSTVDSGNLSGHLLAVAAACREQATDHPPDGVLRLRERLLSVAQACEQHAWEPEFGFLFHRKRQLLHIGLRISEQVLDAGFYDLLASEARLTSLLAIAKGELPHTHWAALGRPAFGSGSKAALRSWSGSMFEYLMPSLVLDEPEGSVLQEACQAAVAEQIAFGARRGIPWGLSESAHAGRDHTLAYQYAAQGVPRLALRRTTSDDLVVTPYATALAAPIAPKAACRNFDELQSLGARGPLGFIEALDFTPSRLDGVSRCVPVATHMAHHQGMTLAALANLLLDGRVRHWGMANARIDAVSSLLHERAPDRVPMLPEAAERPPLRAFTNRPGRLLCETRPGEEGVPPTHLLGNGRYGVTLRPNGAGTSQWGHVGVSRHRDDGLRDACGSFVWIRTRPGMPLVSMTQHPAPDAMADYGCSFHADRACFDARWRQLQSRMTVWVSPEDDIEFRRVELHNLTDAVQEIEVISAFEPSLADPAADEAHPAFGKLFLSAAWRGAQQALIFERKPRLATERPVCAAHFLTEPRANALDLRIQTDRQRWLGRNRPAGHPLAGLQDPPGRGVPSTGAQGDQALDTGLDPMCALSVRLRLEPKARATLTFATAVTDNGGVLSAVIDKYRQGGPVERAALMAATLSGMRLRAAHITPEGFTALLRLTTALVLSLHRPSGDTYRHASRAEPCDRRLLWRLGISGDRPILLVTAGPPQGIGLVRSLAQALGLWSWGGVACDLVILNGEAASYEMPMQRDLSALLDGHAHLARTGSSGTGMHLLRSGSVSAAELDSLKAMARVHLIADGRPLAHHVAEWLALHQRDRAVRMGPARTVVGRAESRTPQAPARSIGTFGNGGGDFSFTAGPGRRPTRPWINVLANPEFGAQISEAGGGYTWSRNSRMNQITAWSNDPVADPASEHLLLQDLRTRTAWSVAPGPASAGVDYQITHSPGHTVIRHELAGAVITARWTVDPVTRIKQVTLTVGNRTSRTLRWRAVGILEWLIGAKRSDRRTVHTALHRELTAGGSLTALLATQCEVSGGFGLGTAFLAAGSAGEAMPAWTCDRRECFDGDGNLVLPDTFGGTSGSGLDPCAVLALAVTVPPGETVERVFLIGHADTPDEARRLAVRAVAVPRADRDARVNAHWIAILGATQVRTPDPLFDALVNHWLVYQTVACRLWAKAGFYQAGGATGFRDQLQDTLALAWAEPRLLRDQIVLAASRQFEEGDVQHWWHEPGGAGVRTRICDDLLWLPYAVTHYLRATNDAGLLDQAVHFLRAPPLAEGSEDRYDSPGQSPEAAGIYEHGARAIDRSLGTGMHGLPLMGGGDWNDGMNQVGIEGRGESVWLGWFLCRVVAEFAPLARSRGDTDRASRWETAARGWTQALLGPAWDGRWFKRAYFDDGSPLGASACTQGRIDLIAQAWSVLSAVAPLEMQRQALQSVEEHLVDHQAGLVRLLTPPLVDATPSAGYIQSYPPGVRENGGQYSHAGVWAVMALAELAQSHPRDAHLADAAWRCFTYLSPAHRAAHPLWGAAYGLEPYVMAGDTCSHPPHVGRGGWSWYTGSAAWMHRAAVESVFGLRLRAEVLSFHPCLPSHWHRAELTLRRGVRTMRFILMRQGESRRDGGWASDGEEREAVVLLPGVTLDWSRLEEHSCFVIPIDADTASSYNPAAVAPMVERADGA